MYIVYRYVYVQCISLELYTGLAEKCQRFLLKAQQKRVPSLIQAQVEPVEGAEGGEVPETTCGPNP